MIWGAIKALSIWGRLGAILTGLLNWAARNPLLALIALLATANLWQWHRAGVAQRAAAHREAVWQRAFGLEQQAYATLALAISTQNASLAALASAGSARQQAARQALGAAVKRSDARDAAAARIEREMPAGAQATDCRTPQAIMDAKGEL